MKNKNVERAIPGGMYGCALLIKNSSIIGLRNLSLGRIHSIIKKALQE